MKLIILTNLLFRSRILWYFKSVAKHILIYRRETVLIDSGDGAETAKNNKLYPSTDSMFFLHLL